MSISLIDTHAHYNSESLDVKKEITLLNNNHNVSKVINIGLNYQTSLEAINLSLNNDNMYATIGIHPLYEGNIKDLEYLYNTYSTHKIVAVGETGLDNSMDLTYQIDRFIDSIKLANKLSLPLIIHSNNTNKMCIEIIKKYPPKYGFVFHFFKPDFEVLKQIISMDGYISVGSNIISKKANKSLEIVRNVPLDNLLIETDYPYLTNNPSSTGYDTFNKICEIKEKNKVYMMNKLNGNAYRLFPKLYN